MRYTFGTTAMVVLTAVAVASGSTIRVPEDSPTVLAAVDLAIPGDSVLVGRGTWTDRDTRTVSTENGSFLVTACAFPHGGVVIRGAGVDATTLDVQGPGGGTYLGVIWLAQRRGEGVLRIESMTVTGVHGAISNTALAGAFSDGLEIRHCRIEGNIGSHGTAVDVGGCPLQMSDCEILNNIGAPAAVSVWDTQAEITRCRFENNWGSCVETLCGDLCPITVRDCQFIRNRGPRYVGMNLQHARPIVEGCLFLENVAETGVGAGIRTSASTGTIQFNVFAYDSCIAPVMVGGGIEVEGGNIATRNNTFVGCFATYYGAAYNAAYGAAGTFTNNVVANHSRPAVVLYAGTTITNGCNLFWMNVADYGAGTPAATDFIADPLFCDLENLDFTVQADSPCLFPPTPSCGPVGGLGVGCGSVAVEPLSFGRVKAMYR